MLIETQEIIKKRPKGRASNSVRIEDFSFPRGVRMANAFLSKFKQEPLVAEELVDTAVKNSGLDDFGSMFWKEPMNVALKDINANTNFHPLGAYIYKQKSILNLENRLWSQYWIKREPSIQESFPPAVLITGLQRTGTTFLQRLLGSLPEFRGVHSWELMNPVPTSERKSGINKLQAIAGHKALNYINPEFKTIHSVGYDSLEEEVVLMEHCYMSSILEAALTTPNYSRWLEQQDQAPAYADLKMWLQILLWRSPASKYILLKSPHHMEYLEDFSKTFPETKIIHTHRHPKETMASYCSMIHLSKKFFQPSSDAFAVGSHWLRKNKRLVDRCMAYKEDNKEQFIDVSYRALVENPVDMAAKIYEQLGMEWTPKHTELALKYCSKHKKNKYGKHVYSLSDYGLTEAKINDSFGEYLDEYKDLL